MKSNDELKELAWRRLWSDKWFGRLFGGGLLLGLCGYGMNVVLGGVLGRLAVADWQEYFLAVVKNRQDVTTPIPNLTNDFIFQATSSMALQTFLSWIMAGITAYGSAVILRRCLRNEEPDWLKAAFGGFAAPFGMFWLFFRMVVIYIGWAMVPVFAIAFAVGLFGSLFKNGDLSASPMAMLAVASVASVGVCIVLLCAMVPIYRYRFLWLVKADHPDWRAGQCLSACRTLMKGNLMKSVKLDCSYWRPLTLLLLLACTATFATSLAAYGILPILNAFLAFAIACLLVALSVVIGQYIGVGQGFLYLELKDSQTIGETTCQ